MGKNDTFTFQKYTYDESTHVGSFSYVVGEYTFTETLAFPTALHPELREQLLLNLHLALGISYWKAYCPTHIDIQSGKLTQKQKAFWDMVYGEGLGEFYYRNQIDFRDLVDFPANESIHIESKQIDQKGKVLVPIGGGKDSLTTVALLKKAGVEFDTFSLGSYDIIEEQAEALGVNHITVERTLDSALFDLPDAYNGHVPISMIYAFVAVAVAASGGYSHVVLSNERSANIGNVEYLGHEINHQWSKSFVFEKAFHNYVKDFITPDVYYFSGLRQDSELSIARMFAGAYPNLDIPFTSCNRNFAIQEKAKQRWCGECPKCAFVFTMLAPYIPKKRLVEVFGKNMLDDTALLPLYQELLGVKDIKPFDCVGTPEEMIVALDMLLNDGQYDGDAILEYYKKEIAQAFIDSMQEITQDVFSPGSEHLIPDNFFHGTA